MNALTALNYQDFERQIVGQSWGLFFSLNGSGPIFLVLGLILSIGLFYLAYRPDPTSRIIAAIASSFLPILLGSCCAVLKLMQAVALLGQKGTADLIEPYPFAMQASCEGAIVCLIAGTAMTCLFLPLGISLLVFCQPKSSR